MAGELVPYSFSLPELPPTESTPFGGTQGVWFTVVPEQLEMILERIELWFEDFDEVILIDHGQTDKQETGTVILEWDGFEVNPLFLKILEHDELVLDYCVYNRPEGT